MRFRLHQSFLVGLATLACLSLPGCNYRDKKDTYYLVADNLKLPYWKTLQDGFEAAAKQYGVTAKVVGPESYDPSAEANAFSDAVAARPAGVLLSAAQASALQRPIADAISAGIPVFTVDSDAPNSQRIAFIGTNNLEVGHIGGKRLIQQLGGKGNVVFFSIPGQPNIEERLKGYKEALADQKGIKIVDVASTSGEGASAFDVAQKYVGETGPNKINAFVCLESECGKAVAEVLKRNNITDRTVIAMDIDPDTLALIKSGAIDSTVSQRPYTMGYLGLKLLDEAHHSHKGAYRPDYSVDFRSPFPTFVDTGSALITQTNAGQYEHPMEEVSQ